MIQTAERVSTDISDNYVFQRSCLAYRKASEMVSGRVLELGTGMGYGLQWLSPAADSLLSIDKMDAAQTVDLSNYGNVELRQMKFPPFQGLADGSFDYAVSFQVIEHIRNDRCFLSEVKRILKPGGKFIVTTPNRLMSLTRNPWHVREYTPAEFTQLLSEFFPHVEAMGVFGNEKIMQYYAQNKAGVERITRFDIFKAQYWMPRCLLQIPYDLLNRLNRRRILQQDNDLVTQIRMDDYFLAPVGDTCFDLFYMAY